MNKKLIIGIILVIAVVAIAIGAVVMLNKNGEENQNTFTSNVENTANYHSNEENAIVGNTANENNVNNNQVASSGKTLVAYFSLPETTGNAKEDSTVTVNGEAIRKYAICGKLNSRTYQGRYF